MDHLTVGKMAFSGDSRYSILHQKLNNWVLVIKEVDMVDNGKYIFTVQTFPEQSLSEFMVRIIKKEEVTHSYSNYTY